MQYTIEPMRPNVRPQDPPDYDGLVFCYVFTQVLTPWTQPPVLGDVTLVVANAQGFVAGMTIVIENGGYYEVVSTDVLNRMTVMNFGTLYNQPPGTGIAPGKVTTTSLPGPPGGTGPPGPQGAQGEEGPIGPPLNPKGSVTNSSALPSTGNQGDLYITLDTGWAWAWDGTEYIALGPFQGPPGNTGAMGPTGSQGPPGAQGNPGPTGPQGNPGSTGPQGPPGSQGPAGSQGPTGPQGPAGTGLNMKGTVPTASALPSTGNQPNDCYTAIDTGHAWVWNGTTWIDIGLIQGPKGDPGPQGPAGTTGAAGATGPQGPTGPTGSQGPAGATGAPGAAGTAATVNAGTTTTGAPGTNANVVNSGTTSAAIFDFTVPRGSMGATGATGPQGPTGATGPQGIQGTIGATGPVGPTGAPGDSDPVGTILMWGTSTAPAGWLLCDGSLVSRTAFPALFSLLGTTFGAGDGSTTFGLPDLRGRTGIGAGTGTGLSSRILGVNGGEETHQLSIAELASHTHVQIAHTHIQDAHNHPAGNASIVQAGTSGYTIAGTTAGNWGVLSATATNQAATAVNQNTGSGTAHNTMPPFLVLYYIIKAAMGGGPTAQAPLADPTQDGLLRKVSGNTTDFVDGTNNCQPIGPAVQPAIWSVRLRSFNAIGNPNFEIDQRTVGIGISGTTNGFALDRWTRSGNLNFSAIQTAGNINLPGTSFCLSQSFLRIALGAQKTTLAATDYMLVSQVIEGPALRELINDVHSISILCRASVPSVTFSVSLVSQAGTVYSIAYLGTTSSTAQAWTLFQIPNVPLWPAGGTFSLPPGNAGYSLRIALAAGSTYTGSSNGSWQAANYFGAVGMGNFAAQAVGTTFDIAFVQHEPGPLCTTLIDKPFTQNLDECLRYYQKTYEYSVKPGTATTQGVCVMQSQANTNPLGSTRFIKPVAKIPTVTGFSDGTGSSAAVRDIYAAGDRAISSVYDLGSSGFGGFALSTQNATATIYTFHYTADTGW